MPTLGIALTIPVSMVVSSFYENKKFTAEYFIGTALIFGSFTGLSIRDYMKTKRLNNEIKKLENKDSEINNPSSP